MKKLDVPFLAHLQPDSPIEHISLALDGLNAHAIDDAPWPEFTYVPKVEFSLAHDNSNILLKYYVREDVVRASIFKPNDAVYKDSCVEFFIAFNGEEEYYNLEFNVLGTCKFNFGIERNERILISESLIKTIRYSATIKNKPDADGEPAIQWELTLVIPVTVFSAHTIPSLSGQRCSANFYKCGDDLPVPHYLCWNNIETPQPDFHVPNFFGQVLFL